MVTAKTVRAAILAASVRTGRPPEDLARLARVPMSLVADPDGRLAHTRMVRAWDALAREAGDPALGLYASQLVDTAATDRLEPLLANAATLADAVRTFLRYQQLYHTANASRAEVTPDAWILTFALHHDAEPSHFLSEFVLGTWLRRLRRAAGGDLAPRQVRLRRERPANAAPYLEAFGPDVRFGATEDALHLDREASSRPIAGANPALRQILERQANAELNALDPGSTFLLDARTTLESLLASGDSDIDALARGMGTSARTLQRRLSEHETSFQTLLADVRRELALRHLAQGNSVTDTAFLLGFSEISAFSRAFRRWTGRAPRAFARQPALG
jgi:AraC-like DNA-binding protein